MAKDKFDEFYENLDREYGKSNTDKNVEYVMSLIKQRLQPDGKVDDNIPVPSLESVAEVMVIMTERPNLTFEQFCEKDRSHKRVIEYLFIRAKNHYDEVEGLIKQLLGKSFKGLTPKIVLAFLKMWRQMNKESRPSSFLKVVQFPERAKEIIDTLHFMIDGEVGKGAATVMFVARDEGLLSSCKYENIKDEFPSIHQKAYNKELAQLDRGDRETFFRPIRTVLRSRIGYTKHDDGRIEFVKTSMSPKNMLYQFFRWLWSFV